MSITALKAFQDNYIWVIQQMSSFICIDPGDANPVLQFAVEHDLTLSAILVTHYHQDHVGGVKQLMQHFPDAALYEPSKHLQSFFINPYQFEVLATPGHTENHVCYFEPNKQWLFCGDTLFSAGCGRIFTGTAEDLFNSLKTLKHLPNETKVFCAHEYTQQNLRFAQHVEPNNQAAKAHLAALKTKPNEISLPSTIALEKAINPFLRLDAPEIQAFTGKTEPLEVFKILRAAKDIFS